MALLYSWMSIINNKMCEM